MLELPDDAARAGRSHWLVPPGSDNAGSVSLSFSQLMNASVCRKQQFVALELAVLCTNPPRIDKTWPSRLSLWKLPCPALGRSPANGAGVRLFRG
jgi:hypothetical protein